MEVYMFNFNACQDLALSEIGNQECASMYSFGPYVRTEYIFHYIVSGKGTVMLNDPGSKDQESLSYHLEVKAGEGFLIGPHTKHMYIADEHHPWHYIWVVFRGLSVPSYLRACGLTKRTPVFYPKEYSEAVSQEILMPLKQILSSPKSSKAFVIGHFHLFFDKLIENSIVDSIHSSTDISISNLYITEATKFIANRYPYIKSLDEIAEYCNITRSHLARLFKQLMNTSLQEYLIEYRLGKAKDLLVNTNLAIYQIASQVGYEEPLSFNKAFKRRMNMSPKEWRIQCRAKLTNDPIDAN